MRVDLVDDHDTRNGHDGAPAVTLHVDGAVGVVELLEDVDHQRGNGPVAVAHLPQGEGPAVVRDPQAVGVDVPDGVVVGQQVVAEDLQGGALQLGRARAVLQGPKVLLDQPADTLRQRGVLVEKAGQPGHGTGPGHAPLNLPEPPTSRRNGP